MSNSWADWGSPTVSDPYLPQVGFSYIIHLIQVVQHYCYADPAPIYRHN